MVDMRMHEFISKNIEVVRVCVKSGMVPPTYLTYLQIYSVYTSCKQLGSKRKRHFYTADVTKTSLSTVIRAIKIMEDSAPS
ncbi:hypothetical protein D3C87_1895200 [compost metagenome]